MSLDVYQLLTAKPADLERMLAEAQARGQTRRDYGVASTMLRGPTAARLANALYGEGEAEADLANRIGVARLNRDDEQAAAAAKALQDQRNYERQLAQDAALQQYRQDSLATTRRGQDMTDARARAAAARVGGLTAYQQEQVRRAEQARLDAQAAKLNAGVQKYGEDVGKLDELQGAIAQANEALAPYRGTGNIPGVGGMSNAPGFIGTVAAKLEGGSKVKNAIAPVENLILKARSGGAVTPQEAGRLLTEFGKVMGATDADFETAWDNFLKRNGEVLNGLAAQHGPEVVDEYNARRATREQAQGGSMPAGVAPSRPAAREYHYDASGNRVR